MPTRKARRASARSAKARTVRPTRSAPKETGGRKSASVVKLERRRQDPETLRLRSLEPTFTVNDINRSLRFYTDVLGFFVGERMADGGVLKGVILKAGVCQIGLSQDDWSKGRDRQKGIGMRIWCKTAQDIDSLAARIRKAGGSLAEEPKDEPWGVRSLTVVDPDGFRISIFSEQ
jgi:uncharacterized glyoxalase superfamily protein PhnB